MSQRKNGEIRSWSTLLIALAGLLLPIGDAYAWDDDTCVDVAGDFTSFIVAGPECTSPVGFCTRGLLVGDLQATYDFTMLTQTPSPTPDNPSRITYTGSSTVTTANGVMFGEDTGEMWFEDGMLFITTVGVVGGTECYDGASGTIVASGAIDMATGEAVGVYDSTLCGAEACLNGRYCVKHGQLPGQGNGHGHDHHY